KQSLKSWARGFGFWIIFIAASVAVMLPGAALLRYFGLHAAFSIDLRWLASSDRWITAAFGYVVLPFVPLLIFDFLIYWFHRMQHAIPFLWRFHSVHHSIEELNGSNCSHHPTEELLRLPFVVLPFTLLLNLHVPEVAVLASFVAIWNQLIHVNAPLSFGPLAYL